MKKDMLYLSNSAQVIGPLLNEDLMKLQKSGEISEYSWVWNSDSQEWDYLSPKPLFDPRVHKSGHEDTLFIVSGKVFEVKICSYNKMGVYIESSHLDLIKHLGHEMPIELLIPAKGFEAWIVKELVVEETLVGIYLRSN